MTVPEVYALMESNCLLMEDFQGHPFKEDRQGRINVIMEMHTRGLSYQDIADFFDKPERAIASFCYKHKKTWKRQKSN